MPPCSKHPPFPEEGCPLCAVAPWVRDLPWVPTPIQNWHIGRLRDEHVNIRVQPDAPLGVMAVVVTPYDDGFDRPASGPSLRILPGGNITEPIAPFPDENPCVAEMGQ